MQGEQLGGSLLYEAGNRPMPSMADTHAMFVGRMSRLPRNTFTAAGGGIESGRSVGPAVLINLG